MPSAGLSPEPEPVRVVVLTGAPGAGKSETARRLVRRYECPAALIDTDMIADVYPWRVDARLYELISENLRSCLSSYRRWGARVVVVSGVLLPGRSLRLLASLIADPGLRWVFYGLRANAAQLSERILADTKVQDAQERMSWSFLDAEVPVLPGVRLVETGDVPLAEVVDRIAAAEAADLPPGTLITTAASRPGASQASRSFPARPSGRPGTVGVTLKSAARAGQDALVNAGMSASVAEATVADLLDAERTGQRSHGLLRIPEYAAAIADGSLDPSARPVVSRTGPAAVVIDGRHAPGVVVRRLLAAELARAADGVPVTVALRASGHLGRLAPLAREVTSRGLVLLGFVNFSGTGQKVAPEGGVTGRWATNPLVLACPCPPGDPLVVDMSTSAVAEGRIRAALLAGQALPPGALIGQDGRPVRDPALLYESPPRAAIAPLGGLASHKGHALAAFTEAMAGAVAGAGHVGAPERPGNGGLFIAFPATSFARSAQDVTEAILRVEEHLRAGAAPGRGPRLPGRRGHQDRAGQDGQPETISVPASLWKEIRGLAGRSSASADHL